ncbi:hypothetical protein Pint_16684 [Pistacia integerrima]|uniref:Uncharacterized protein n=1 Tax=Pistacia integerrima TaxID=434235 RepID=A0ACC0ZEA1_9ROSI|nr:hypothetical protein Pint_16684 [Pistacia integerrima]
MTESALCQYSPDMLVSTYKKRFGKWDYHSTIQGGGLGESMVTSSLCSLKEHLSGWDLLPMLNHGSQHQQFQCVALLHIGDQGTRRFLVPIQPFACVSEPSKLLFQYTPEYNVLEVTQLAFMNCLTTNPVSEYNDGPTTIELSEPGTRFFISGGPESCLIKLSIDVSSLPD